MYMDKMDNNRVKMGKDFIYKWSFIENMNCDFCWKRGFLEYVILFCNVYLIQDRYRCRYD